MKVEIYDEKTDTGALDLRLDNGYPFLIPYLDSPYEEKKKLEEYMG